MSHTNILKNRLGEMFLRDRGSLNENTAQLVKSEIKHTLDTFFDISDFAATFTPSENGEVLLTVKMVGMRR